jgi:hypothetical protein
MAVAYGVRLLGLPLKPVGANRRRDDLAGGRSYSQDLSISPTLGISRLRQTHILAAFGATLDFAPGKYRGTHRATPYAAIGSYDHPIRPVVPTTADSYVVRA